MKNSNICATLALIVAAGLAVGQPASAQTVTLGGTDTGSYYPFGGDNSSATGNDINYTGQFQQIYNGTSLSTLPVIRQLAFSSAAPFSLSDLAGINVPETVNYNFTITLSSTAATPVGTYTNFVTQGANATTVFTGSLTANLTADNSFDLVIPFQTPFTFNPASGNLLLNVVINSTNAGPNGQTDAFQAGTDANTGTIAFINGRDTPTGAPISGLLTQFSAAPEPSPILALGVGIGGAALLIARRRRASAANNG